MSNLTDWMGKCHELEAENERLKNQNTLLKVFESEEVARLKAWNQERAGQFAATEQRLASRIAELNAENTFLRIKVQKLGCPYNNTHENGACKSGYPGCACMDDLMALMNYQPGDEERAVVRAHERIIGLEQQIEGQNLYTGALEEMADGHMLKHAQKVADMAAKKSGAAKSI